MIQNRSLRSVTLIIVGWVSCRAILLNWPPPLPAEQLSVSIGKVSISAEPAEHEMRSAPVLRDRADRPVGAIYTENAVAIGKAHSARTTQATGLQIASLVDVAASSKIPKTRDDDHVRPAFEPALLARSNGSDVPLELPVIAPVKRWTVSAWLLQRAGEGRIALAANGQLGGSQVGFRVQRELFRPLYGIETRLNVRVSGAIATLPGAEAAIGLSFKKRGAVPLELLVERRIGFNGGGRDDFAIVAVTGMNEVPVARIARATAYLQAGIVGLKNAELFADGAMRVERRLASAGSTNISLGFGGWGAIQSGASRLDIGPIMSSQFRIGKASMRMSAEWRERIAGHASPASGPSLSVGMDF